MTTKVPADMMATGAVGTTQLADGALAASSAGRAKMADGFLSADSTGRGKMADAFLTAAKMGNSGSEFGMRNRIINGDFRVAQRGTSFTSATTPANSDDTYLLDRWFVLSDGNDIVDVTQEASVVPTGGQTAIALDVETANKKFGIAQIIEAKNCKGLIGNTVTLSFKAKVSATTKLDNLKAAIVAWSGTADSVTSDIISAWGDEGTNPTLIANATFENTPANLSPTTSYQTFTISAAVDTASAANVIVFIWSDVTDTTAGDFLYITDVQLEPGANATPFEHRPHGTEMALCQRYYEKSFPYATAPAQNSGVAGGTYSMPQTAGASTGNTLGTVVFQVAKRAAPAVTFYNPSAANAQVRNSSVGADCSNTTAGSIGERSFHLTATTAGGSASGNTNGVHWAADAEL